MQVVQDDLWLCPDCMYAAVNGDAPESEEQDKATTAGLERLGHLVPNWHNEHDGYYSGHNDHSIDACDCCRSRLHGERWRFYARGQ